MTDLDTLLTEAMAAFNRLSPAEQAAHRFEQRVSWTYGQLALSGREVTQEQVREWLRESDAGAGR